MHDFVQLYFGYGNRCKNISWHLFCNGRQYRITDNHFFKFIFLYENGCILIQISLKSVEQYANIGSDNSFAHNKQQAIISTHDYLL